jgi:L-alanine-DL-glutamate epimerase-like enolase superfamily enzyme
MRIRRLEVFTARLPLEPGFSHFTGRVTAPEVFVRLTADDGLVGWGEGRGNMSSFSGESPASIVAALRDHLAPLVLGRPLRERGMAIAQFDRALAGNAAAKAAPDIAIAVLGRPARHA